MFWTGLQCLIEELTWIIIINCRPKTCKIYRFRIYNTIYFMTKDFNSNRLGVMDEYMQWDRHTH